MGVNRLPMTVTRQRCGCDLNPGPSAPESSTLTTRLYDTRYYFKVRSKADETEPTAKKCKTEKLKKYKKRICSEVSVNSLGYPCSQS